MPTINYLSPKNLIFHAKTNLYKLKTFDLGIPTKNYLSQKNLTLACQQQIISVTKI